MLATMALVLRVMIPPGFMVGQSDPTSGFRMVMCSGAGSYTLVMPGDSKSPPVKKLDAPCAFAGAAVPLTPTVAVLPARLRIEIPAATPVVERDQAPGRGLAAPPPPAIGPPRLI